MSVHPGKHRKIFGLYEDSFHDFKGRYLKSFSVRNHRPFWLTLEGDGQFPPYWNDQAGFEIVPVTYQQLNADQKDTTDILIHLFSKNILAPKSLLGNQEEAWRVIVEMASNDVTLARLRRCLRPSPRGSIPANSVNVSVGGAQPMPVGSMGKTQAVSEGGGSSDAADATDQLIEVSSPVKEEIPSPPPSPRGKRPAADSSVDSKRPRASKGGSREFCTMDRSFDASGFIEDNLLGPQAQEILRDYDPMESIC
ncbi:hypothetical protein PIB30_072645 [Stylosanthes scabra]|uniref:Uncharacterized protein n=1 Tax=Stylosanthes scabra TaxID=79078 RepID=A0ABU6XN18_9FABA|nr:hypothetical protein [Stylosanthes scabra]